MAHKKKSSRKVRQQRELEKIQQNINTENGYNDCSIKKTFSLKDIGSVQPATKHQHDAFQMFFQGDNLLLKGSAGTGKTFIALYLALQEVFRDESPYDKVVIIRSALPVRDSGHLPGTIEEKVAPYEAPYRGLCDELFDFKNSYDNMKKSGYIEFVPTTFIRGITLHNSILLLDEVQNMTWEEINSTITRAGDNTSFIICGDTKQSDHIKSFDRSAIGKLQQVLEMMNSFDVVEFDKDDIIRSGTVREFIIACEDLGF